MSLGGLLLRFLLLAGIGAGAAQYWLLQRAEFEAQRLIAQWQGYGRIHYDRLWVYLWGSGFVDGLSFEPTGLTQATLGLPLGYKLQIDTLHFERPSLDPQNRLSQLRLRFDGLHLPMQDAYKLRGRNPPPALLHLGYGELLLDGRLSIRQLGDADLLLVDGDVNGADFADIDFSLQLDADQNRLLKAPDQIGLRKLTVDYADRGLMQRYLGYSAAMMRLPPETARNALIAQLDERARREAWTWDESSREALRAFLRDPVGFHLVLDPPRDVVVRDLSLYKIGDWPAVLGFKLQPPEQLAPASSR